MEKKPRSMAIITDSKFRFLFLLTWLFTSGAALKAQKSVVIESNRLQTHLYVLADDSLLGRNTATVGQRKAANYLCDQFERFGLSKILSDSNGKETWLQEFPFVKRFGDKTKYFPVSHNIIGFLPGSGRLAKETLVVSAHYDHLGANDSVVFNGADDNASGTAAVLEIARVMTEKSREKLYPYNRRNVLFILFSGEEKGLMGSKHYAKYPVLPFKKTAANLNVDMVGRADSMHQLDSNYIYLIGSDLISPRLHEISEMAKNNCCDIALDYSYSDTIHPLRLYFRSDHYNFAKNGVPVIFYFSGLHADYHKPEDTAQKINLRILHNRSNLVLHTAEAVMLEKRKIKRKKNARN